MGGAELLKKDQPHAQDELDVRGSSNGIYLTGRQWLGVGLFALVMVLGTPWLWEKIERFDLEPDYRIPHDLSNDYWLYSRYSRLAAEHCDTLLIGDSVIWGEYVTRQQTLSHYLNEQAGQERFANLGLDGAHPLALTGLVEHYARAVSGKNVILFCNLLWLSSPRADLQVAPKDDKQINDFNHPRLIPQFFPRIPAFRAEISPRIGVVVEEHVAFNSWTNHLQQAYYDRTDIPSWTLDHQYDNPLKPLFKSLPGPDEPLRHTPQPWYKSGITMQDYPWVELETSLQWRAFQRVVDVLQRRGNRVFVLVGPFNEHLLKKENQPAYQKVKATIETWLRVNQVAHLVPPPLPSELYGDASHPLGAGYAQLARQLFERLPP
jgi:hypothetical protein